MLKLEIPIIDDFMVAPIACNGCGKATPFTLREFEAGQVVLGWQMRPFGTGVDRGGRPVPDWRWGVFCPECAAPRTDPVVSFKRIERDIS